MLNKTILINNVMLKNKIYKKIRLSHIVQKIFTEEIRQFKNFLWVFLNVCHYSGCCQLFTVNFDSCIQLSFSVNIAIISLDLNFKFENTHEIW